MEPFMKLRSLAALAVLVLLAPAVTRALAADKPQDLIIGKWRQSEGKGHLEFLKDGKLKFLIPQNSSVDGTYKFLDDKTLEIKMSFEGQETKTKLKVTVTKDELTMQEEGEDRKSV